MRGRERERERERRECYVVFTSCYAYQEFVNIKMLDRLVLMRSRDFKSFLSFGNVLRARQRRWAAMDECFPVSLRVVQGWWWWRRMVERWQVLSLSLSLHYTLHHLHPLPPHNHHQHHYSFCSRFLKETEQLFLLRNVKPSSPKTHAKLTKKVIHSSICHHLHAVLYIYICYMRFLLTKNPSLFFWKKNLPIGSSRHISLHPPPPPPP